MRSIRWMVFGFGLALLLSSVRSEAQDATRPAVKVVIGADGSVKVFDAKTGKEIVTDIIKVQKSTGAIQFPAGDKKQTDQLEQARKELERMLQELNKPKADPAKKPAAIGKLIQLEFDLQILPGGQPRIVQLQRAQTAVEKPVTLEQKVDLLLKQMGELRRDVDQLKNKLEGKQPETKNYWQVVPAAPKDAKDKPAPRFQIELKPIQGQEKKPSNPQIQIVPVPAKKGTPEEQALQNRLQELLKGIEKANEAQRDKAKPAQPKAVDPLQRKAAPMAPSANNEQTLQRILQELEELRREIRGKSSK